MNRNHQKRIKDNIYFCLLICLVAFSATAYAAEPTPEQLIARLADDSYSVRLEAEKELLKLGRKAFTALKLALDDPDPNTRKIADRLLSVVKRTPEEIKIDEFLKGGKLNGLPPLPGWNRIKSLVGDDYESRLLYVQLLKYDRKAVYLIESGPKEIARQLPLRTTQLSTKINSFNQARANGKTEEELQGKEQQILNDTFLLILCAKWGSMDPNQENLFTQVISQAISLDPVSSCNPLRELLTGYFNSRIRTIDDLGQVVHIMGNLGLTDLIEKQILPLLEREMKKGIAGKNIDKLNQVINLVEHLDLEDSMAMQIRQAMEVIGDKAIRERNMNALLSVIGFCNRDMQNCQDYFQFRIRPSVLKVLNEKTNPQQLLPRESEAINTWINELHLLNSLSRMAGFKEVYIQRVRPLIIRMILDHSKVRDDFNFMENFLGLAQQNEMTEIIEGIVKPLIRKRIFEIMERFHPEDNKSLNELLRLSVITNLDDFVVYSIRPFFERQAPSLLANAMRSLDSNSPDLNPLCQFYNAANLFGATKVSEELLKPALANYFRKKAVRFRDGMNGSSFQQLLEIAKSLKIKEAALFAYRLASMKTNSPELRAQSLLFLGQFGDAGKLARVESFLNDTTKVNEVNLQTGNIKTQIRDIALAILLEEKKEKLGDFGFVFFKTNPMADLYDMPSYACGFDNDKSRINARKKYEDLQKK